jgi:hypothetical protein
MKRRVEVFDEKKPDAEATVGCQGKRVIIEVVENGFIVTTFGAYAPTQQRVYTDVEGAADDVRARLQECAKAFKLSAAPEVLNG